MSEQNNNFMAALDQWTEDAILRPWYEAVETYIKSPNDPKADDDIRTMDAFIKDAVRGKILESYRNGQAAAPRKVFKRP
jgi:predicted NAD/FAD-dependent oxidoreductase